MSNSVHSLDNERLAAYLKKQIDGFQGPLTSEKFAGGQSNPTFLLTTSNNKYVLRRKPPGQLLKSAHAVDREFKVLQALKDTDVPVAKPYCLCEDDSVIGSMFYIMSYEEGQIYWDPALPELNTDARAPLHNEMIRVLAAMHNLDVNAIGLNDYGRPGNYFERQFSRWTKQYRAAETERLEAMETLMSWLSSRIPEDDGQISLIHGDYRLDNVMFAPDQPRALAVLDWELSTLGHPMADLAYLCMCMRLPRTGQVKGLGGMNLEQQGIPNEEQLIAHYCALRGIDGVNNWTFYLAFSFFRLASICQGVYKRALDGNASNEKAMETGKFTSILAELAIVMIEQEGLNKKD